MNVDERDFFDSCFATGIDCSVAQKAWDELKRRAKGPLAKAAERRPADYHTLSPEAQWEIDKNLGIVDWDGSPQT